VRKRLEAVTRALKAVRATAEGDDKDGTQLEPLEKLLRGAARLVTARSSSHSTDTTNHDSYSPFLLP
jgi:hypothetical protein